MPNISTDYCLECLCLENDIEIEDKISNITFTSTSKINATESLPRTTSDASDAISVVNTTKRDATSFSSKIPTERTTGIITSIASTTIATCLSESRVGDGYCDDDTNNVICNYDGGDCCLPEINKLYCNQCQCLGED